MNLLGLNYYFHDSSACIVKDGSLEVALEEERFTRQKHTGQFPVKSIEKCLELSGLEFGDIDAIAVSIKPTLHWPKKVAYALRNLSKSRPFIKHELINGYWKQRTFWSWINKNWPNEASRPSIHFVPHHMSHAAGTFYVSPYENAAILSLDGSGEWASSMLAHGMGIEVKEISQTNFPMSLGSFYEAATEFCGFKPNYDEGKTMGLAPFGDPEVFRDEVEKLITIDSEGRIDIDLSFFEYQFWNYRRCSDKFYQVFGEPRRGKDFADNHHNVAAAFQYVLEERGLQLARILKEKTNEKYLVISGGVSLNSVMNGRIVKETDFDDIYVMPAAGDNGTAIGAAYYAYHSIYRKPRTFVHANPYVGTEYNNKEIKKVLDEAKLTAEYHDDVISPAADYLHRGKIIGWFQGKMEIGPRALGSRSILANPTLPMMKDKINAEVKHREPYRPFAPSAIAEFQGDYFDLPVLAPFMLKVCDVIPEKRKTLPAITHVDGSARLQTVLKDTHPLYHALISEFGKLSGVPVVLNTSFNVMGEPVVESPLQAIRCFYSTGLDVLVIGNYIIEKNWQG